MKKLLILSGLILLSQLSFSQWALLNNLTTAVGAGAGAGRANAASFAIGDTGFFIAGSNSSALTDCWKYNVTSGSWTRIKDFPTDSNSGSVGFAIGDTGYVGLGAHAGFYQFTNSFYKYHFNTWTKIASLPGPARWGAFAFVANDTAYVGGGMNSSNSNQLSDFYKYDPTHNQWTRVADCPVGMGPLFCFAFAINGKGYVGAGGLQTGGSTSGTFEPQSNFYQYDPATNTWTSKAAFGGGVQMCAFGFATCNKGYAGSGTTIASQLDNDPDFYQYDPGKDAWTKLPDIGGVPRYRASTFVINNVGYVCGGVHATTSTYYGDLYSWTPVDTAGFKSTTATICAGSAVTFTDTTSSFTPTTWQWTFTGGTPGASTVQNPTITYNTPGNYGVTLTASDGTCDNSTVTFTGYVTVGNTISIGITPAMPSICSGQNITLHATGGGSYKWLGTGLTCDSVQANPTSDASYTLQVSNGTCSADTIILVTVTPMPVPVINTPQPVCSGNAVDLIAGGGASYSWSSGITSTSNSITVTPLSTTIYTVTVANGACRASDTATVTVNPMPTSGAVGTATIVIGQSTALGVTSLNTGDVYSWTPASTLSCNTCANPIATPSVTTWYNVAITDASGCSKQDSVLVTVNETCGPVYMPTAFSPNGDGNNDLYKIYGNCIKNLDLIIYDRWGNIVFETTNPSVGWDGTSKGRALNSGTYVFSVEATDQDNNTISQRGNITLLR